MPFSSSNFLSATPAHIRFQDKHSSRNNYREEKQHIKKKKKTLEKGSKKLLKEYCQAQVLQHYKSSYNLNSTYFWIKKI